MTNTIFELFAQQPNFTALRRNIPAYQEEELLAEEKKETPIGQQTNTPSGSERQGITTAGSFFDKLKVVPPAKPNNTGVLSTIGKMQEYTKPDMVQPKKQSKDLGGILGGVLNMFDKSYEGTGKRDDSRLYNALAGNRQIDKDYNDAMYMAQRDDQAKELDTYKINNEIKKQQLEEQLTLNKLMDAQNQQDFTNRYNLAKGKEDSLYKRGITNAANAKTTDKTSDLDKKILLKAFDIAAKRDPGFFDKSNEEKAIEMGVISEQLKAAMNIPVR